MIKLHYSDPLKDITDGIRFLGYDNTTFTMFISLLHQYKIIDVWTEHEYEDDNYVGVESGSKGVKLNFGGSQSVY